MAKKRKTTRKKKTPVKSKPKHNLPTGFWSQICALILIAISVMLIVTWFNAGGPVLEWFYQIISGGIGYAVYILPALFLYLAIEIFRSEENHLPLVVEIASVFVVVLFSALFGLLRDSNGYATGGVIGDVINKGMLALVNGGIAAFIYTLLLVITLLFIFRTSPFTVIEKLLELFRRDVSDLDANVKVMHNAAAVDGSGTDKFKLNAGVPTLDTSEAEVSDKKSSKSSGTNAAHDKSSDETTALVTIGDPDWEGPSLDLLEKKQSPADAGDVQQNAKIIQNTLSEFDIDVKMEGANIGPRVTQFTMKPTSGVKLKRITALETNIALNLAAQSLRMEAPIPGQKAVGIEVPNRKAADVRLYSVLSSPKWDKKTGPLSFAVGQDISGEVVIGDLSAMPHLLIAGTTGSGKSVMINTLLNSLLYHNSPSDLKLILVDPKEGIEMASYEDIPHLLTPIITEPEKMISALKWSVNEMQRRYQLLREHKVRDIKSYNKKIQTDGVKIAVQDEDGVSQDHENGAMPYIVIVIDELAELMMVASKDAETLIVRLAQKARAVGIHLVLATQRPDANVITGLIKANVPAKIAFTVANQINSRIIIDDTGAEKLLGSGDMLYKTAEMGKPIRVQGAYVSDGEIHKVTDYLRIQSPPQYNDEVVSEPVQFNGRGGVVMDFDNNDDTLYNDAIKVVVDSGKASASLLQRRLRIGYARAARLIESMEDQGIIGPADGARSREVLISNYDETEEEQLDEDSI